MAGVGVLACCAAVVVALAAWACGFAAPFHVAMAVAYRCKHGRS